MEKMQMLRLTTIINIRNKQNNMLVACSLFSYDYARFDDFK